jgi:hypothetical protein
MNRDSVIRGFEIQGVTPYCGAYSFRHSLLLLGTPMTKSRARKLTKSTVSGTNETNIKRGIRQLGYKLGEIETYSIKSFSSYLDKSIKLGSPVILWINWDPDSFNDTGHWVVCAGKVGKKYIIIDSAPKRRKIISLYSLKELSDERCYYWIDEDEYDDYGIYWDDDSECYVTEEDDIFYDEDEDAFYYYYYYGVAIKPSVNESAVKKLPSIVHQLMREKQLRKRWGYYLNDLIRIFDFNNKKSSTWLSVKDFFRHHREDIIETLDTWTDYEKFGLVEIKREIRYYEIIAGCFNMGFRKSKMNEVSMNFTICLLQTLIENYVLEV